MTRRRLTRTAARLTIACALVLVSASTAAADWLITPFLGSTFHSRTPFIDPEQSAGASRFTFGGSAAWVSDGLFGVETDFAYTARFFERNSRAGLISGSNVTTLTGNEIGRASCRERV